MSLGRRPLGPGSSFINGVSCTSLAACVAVGDSVGLADPARPVERAMSASWDGRTWKARAVAKVKGAVDTILTGLSCPSAADCTAIGFYPTTSFAFEQFAESWDGRFWTAASTPRQAGLGVSLTSLSCACAIACMAVGGYRTAAGGLPAAQSWDGQVWADRSPRVAAGASGTSLTGISCASASACMAVGSAISTKTAAIAQWWNGRAWESRRCPCRRAHRPPRSPASA